MTTNRPLKVFLCHSSADKPAVHELCQKLRTEPWIEPWLDEEELFPGMDWNLEIEKAIEATDVILVCLSNNSITKEGYVQREIRIALDYADYKPEGMLFIIPVRLEEFKIPFRYSKWQYVDYFEGQRDKAFQRLLVSLRRSAESFNLKKVSASPSQRETKSRKEANSSTKNKPKTSSESLDVGGNISGSVVVSGNNNVINFSAGKGNTKRSRLSRKNYAKKKKSQRVLEAAIEKKIFVGKPASLFVWVKRLGSTNIVFALKSIDENALLDEENVKSRDLEIEFPIVKGEILSAEVVLRLVAHEFEPSIQQKKIEVPPEGDSEVCTFIIIPKQAGELLLSLEVLKNDISLANRTLRTTAIEIEKKTDSSLVFVKIPIVVIVQATETDDEKPVVKISKSVPSRRPAIDLISSNKLTFSNSMEFMRIPAGKFLMGEGREQHTVEIPYDYWMARFPITNAQYSQFKEKSFDRNKEKHPVVDVSWYDAMEYCQWLNQLLRNELPSGLVLRLPTEAEWENAARGTDGRQYPWGNTFDKNKCNTHESGKGDTTSVGLYSPQGDSPYGCADVSGNVWEWTYSLGKKYPYNVNDWRKHENAIGTREIRGGSFLNSSDFARCAICGGFLPDDSSGNIGFRVIVSRRLPSQL